MEYCNFKILTDGQTFIKTSYAKVELKNIHVYDFLSGNVNPTDADEVNLRRREQCKVKANPLEELPFIYKTQKFILWKIRQIIGVSSYLLQVVDLAKKIATKFKESGKNNDAEKYIDILLEINADKDDLIYSKYCHQVQDAYKELIQNIPKDLIPTKTTAGEQNRTCSTAVFLCLCKFLKTLENEFFFFATSEIFLNNPTGETILVLPHSLYKRFGFDSGGLTSTERLNFPLSNSLKYAEQKADFYSELKRELEHILNGATEIKLVLLQKSDDLIMERLIDRFEQTFAGQTCGRMTKIKRLLGNLIFRERLTEFFCEFKPHLIENLANGKASWKNDISTKSHDSKDACYFYYLLCKRYLKNERIGLTEFSRLANLYPRKLSPQSILSRNSAEFEKEHYCFSEKNREKYEELLER